MCFNLFDQLQASMRQRCYRDLTKCVIMNMNDQLYMLIAQ